LPPEEQNATQASFAQRSMWATAQRYRNAPLNVLVLRWRLQGYIQANVLEVALRDLCARHPTLTARLRLVENQLLQVIGNPATESIRVIDVHGEGPEVRLQAALRRLREEARNFVDLGSGPLFKAYLLNLTDTDHVLSFVVHHAICDGWSSQIIIRDLAAFYEARMRGRAAILPALTEQYSDFAQTQFRTFESGGYAEEIEYWRAELADAPSPLQLPTSRARRGARDWECEFPAQVETPAVNRDIRAFARRRRVTSFSVFLAGLSVLLHDRTGVEDMLIGVSTLNRWSNSSLLFVGCATNLLPARIRLHRGMGFDELCGQVHSMMRRLLTFGRIPLELILREVKEPLFTSTALPIWCQYRDVFPAVTIDSEGLTLMPMEIERASLSCELEVDLLGSQEGLRCEFAYRPGLFDRDMIIDLMAKFAAILRTAPHASEVSIDVLIKLLNRPREGNA
jgi:hypothetical protein